MISKIDIGKLQRFIEGASSSIEEEYVHELFIEKEGDREFKKHLQLSFNEYLINNPEEDNDLSYLLDRIHYIIHKNEGSIKRNLIKQISHWYSVAAAVLLIPILLAGGIWFLNTSIGEEQFVTSTLFAPLGARISFLLPDGTKGWLNSGSSIKYQLPFNNNRHISISGEAWFDVAHDAGNPFEIAVGNCYVKVLGTKFNLNAYPEEKNIEVVLEKGIVEFYVDNHTEGIRLKPDERLVFDSKIININKTDAKRYSAWKEGKLIFRNDPMEEVVARIERWYNIDIELVDDELKEYLIWGTFQDDSLEDVMHYLCRISPISFQIIDVKPKQGEDNPKKKVQLFKNNINL